MNYEAMLKPELIELLKAQEHLPSAIQAKDRELSDLGARYDRDTLALKESNQQNKDALIAKMDKAVADTKAEYEQKIFLQTQLTEKDHISLFEIITNTQKNYETLDKLRIAQLEQVLYAHGDLLKGIQAMLDTHMKLNQFIVKDVLGGNE